MGAHFRPGLLRRTFNRAGRPAAPPLLNDDLTDLPGRLALKAALEDHIVAGRRMAFILFDLDRFAAYNDRLGRPAGDAALRRVGGSLTVAAPGRSFRCGADQFAVLLDAPSADSATAWAEKVRGALDMPASAAVVMLGRHTRADGVLRDADLTMALVKDGGGDRAATYSPAVEGWARNRRSEMEELSREVEGLRMENEKLLQAMLVDPQTGLPNAAAFEADHSQLEARRRRSEDPYAILLADIDHFHAFNELFGERAGQEAMKLVATTIGQTVRESDRTYRLGGEEFAVLLPGAEVREAVAAAERVRKKVERLAIMHPANNPGVLTVTIAALGAGFRHRTTKDMITELQDLMSGGTQAGRNRVVWPH